MKTFKSDKIIKLGNGLIKQIIHWSNGDVAQVIYQLNRKYHREDGPGCYLL